MHLDALAESTDVAEESISNIRTVRAFSKEDYHVAKYVSKVTKSYDLGVRKAVADGKNDTCQRKGDLRACVRVCMCAWAMCLYIYVCVFVCVCVCLCVCELV